MLKKEIKCGITNIETDVHKDVFSLRLFGFEFCEISALFDNLTDRSFDNLKTFKNWPDDLIITQYLHVEHSKE